VIPRFSSNTKGEKYIHTIPHYKWKDHFKNKCNACKPTFTVVESLTSESRSSAVFVDRDLNIRIRTEKGLQFNGYLKAHYPTDLSCQRINKPVYLKLNFEICGFE